MRLYKLNWMEKPKCCSNTWTMCMCVVCNTLREAKGSAWWTKSSMNDLNRLCANWLLIAAAFSCATTWDMRIWRASLPNGFCLCKLPQRNKPLYRFVPGLVLLPSSSWTWDWRFFEWLTDIISIIEDCTNLFAADVYRIMGHQITSG